MIPSAGYKTLRKTLCKTTIPVLGPNHLSTDVTISHRSDNITHFLTMSNYTRKNNKRAANDPNINRAAHYFNDRKKAGNEIEYSEALTYAGFYVPADTSDKSYKRLLHSVRVSYFRVKKNDPDAGKPSVLHSVMSDRINLIDIPDDLKKSFAELNGQWKGKIKGAKNKPQGWAVITKTNLMQLKIGSNYRGLFGRNETDADLSTSFQKMIKSFFGQLNLGIDVDKIHITLIITSTDEFKVQRPHTDYPLVKLPPKSKDMLPWTAHIPLTDKGSWIIVWSGPGHGTSVQIPFGKCLLLRSDVVHAGGKPDGAGVKGENYLRMHFYLPTDYMVPDPDVINKYDYDGKQFKKRYVFLPDGDFF